MKITRETDYAMRCIAYLARQKRKVVMADEISREMGIPKSFVAKILQKLARAGMVQSFRGIKGGFSLARDTKEITLLDVIETIEGAVTLNECAVNKNICGFSKTCPVHPVWIQVRREFVDILKKYNFHDLIRPGTKKRLTENRC